MMNMLLRRKCCCATLPVKQWTASVCTSGSCVFTCAGAVATCIPTITFCDSYRQTIGLPDALDPTKCYIMVLGGCLYVVNGFTYVSSCNDTPTSTRNIGTLYGVYDKPTGNCDTLCPDIQNLGYYFGPDTWTGGINCGTNITLTYAWTNAYCKGTVDDPCNPVYPDACVKKVGTITSQWNLGEFPISFYGVPTQCTPDQAPCTDCTTYNPVTAPSSMNYSNQIAAPNNCNLLFPTDPCGSNPSCTVTGAFSCTIQQIAPEYRTYSFAFSITRSCTYPFGDGSGWVQDGFGNVWNGGDRIQIDGCIFRLDGPGCKSSTLANKINSVLGQASQTGSATFSASGNNSWIGSACPTIPATTCSNCIDGPYSWDGPYYSNGNKTATWYAAPQYTYTFLSILQTYNSSFNRPGYGCQCTGSPYGSNAGQYMSTNFYDVFGPAIEYGVSLSGTSFSMIDVPGASNAPCCPPPSMS